MKPWGCGPMATLEMFDIGHIVSQDGADLIEPEKQGAAPMRVDAKGDRLTVWQPDCFGLQIDRERLLRQCRRHHTPMGIFSQINGEDAVSEAVRKKNLAKTWRDNATDAGIG